MRRRMFSCIWDEINDAPCLCGKSCVFKLLRKVDPWGKRLAGQRGNFCRGNPSVLRESVD